VNNIKFSLTKVYHLLTSILLIQALLNPKYVGIFLFSKTIEFQVLGVEGKNNTFVGTVGWLLHGTD
jgi:hypothetical protein